MNKISGKLVITSYNYDKFHKKGETRRVACFIANNKLEYLKVVPDEETLPVGTILTGKVANIVHNIPAAFISLNSDKEMGFLSLKELEHAVVTNRKFNGKLQSGDEVAVKVIREPMKTKDYTVTAQLDITGRYASAQMGDGALLFSKKISDKEKECIFSYLVSKAVITREKKLIGTDDINIIVRTDAAKLITEGRLELLTQDIAYTGNSLKQLISQAFMRTCYTVHQKPETWITDMWHELSLCGFTIEEYVTDQYEMFKVLQEVVSEHMHHKIRLYQDEILSLSTLYGLKEKLDELMQTKVWLPSGGYLCIEPTEALTVIDVNTGKAIHNGDTSEELFVTINKEAAYETARQLRLRNISGIVIIDFVNMKSKQNEALVLEVMKQCSRQDFSKISIYNFTKLGLLEMTRNKKSKSFYEIMRG